MKERHLSWLHHSKAFRLHHEQFQPFQNIFFKNQVYLDLLTSKRLYLPQLLFLNLQDPLSPCSFDLTVIVSNPATVAEAGFVP